MTPFTHSRHKSQRLALALGFTAIGVPLAALAQTAPASETGDMARVVSSVPVFQQVAIPRQMCTDELVTTPGQKSGAGAVMGGVAGGAIGNQIGQGSGRAAATAIGIIGGAILGDRIEGGGTPSTQSVQRCTTQTVYETRAVAYNVTYEFAGKTYTVQMPQDPGQWVRVQVSPVIPGSAPAYSNPSYSAPTYSPPVVVRPYSQYVAPATITSETTYYPATVYPAYPVVRPSLWVDLSVGDRHHHRPHHHWR